MIKLILGDWSDDGHGKTSDVIIESSLTGKEIEEAFKVGAKIIGEDITDYCDEYEDFTIPKKALEKISEFISHEDIKEILAEDEDNPYLEQELYAYIYLETAKIGNKDFEYKILYLPELYIGGYGLFCG